MEEDNTSRKPIDINSLSVSRVCVCSLKTDVSGVNATATGTADLTGCWLEEEFQQQETLMSDSAGLPPTLSIRALGKQLQRLQNAPVSDVKSQEPSSEEHLLNQIQCRNEMKVSADFTFQVTGMKDAHVEAGLFLYVMEVKEKDGTTKRMYSRSGIRSKEDIDIESSDSQSVRATGTITV